jgi:nucleoid-associated protein YgaU
MRREWLMVLLAVGLLMSVGCGTTARAVNTDGNLSDSATQNVRVNESAAGNQPPRAVISGPTSGSVGENLSFSGANSTDPDGRIVSYAWNFGDGTTGSGVNVTHSYKAAGTYKVTLTVTDDGRGTAQATIQTQTSPASETYTVQSGDTLMEISRKLFDGDPQYWDEIADLNDIKAPNYTIYPGQQLKVPKK